MNASKRGMGYTIIEVMLFFGVTGLLMLGVMGSASVGVNTQRYNDAASTFGATVQQEFTNASNVVNTQSLATVCGLGADRGTSDCLIIGRLMTVDANGNIVTSNVIGKEPPAPLSTTISELQVFQQYSPEIDTSSQEKAAMSWGTNIEKAGATSQTSLLIIRSPRTGNIYSYVIPSTLILGNAQLTNTLATIVAQPTPQNADDQYMCVDQSGWVVTAQRVITIAPFSSGPNGVSVGDVKGSECS